MIPAEKRNSVRIVELPACKLVWSGVCTDGSPCFLSLVVLA